MEMALMQRSALSRFVVAETSNGSSRSQTCGGCGSSGSTFLSTVESRGLSSSSSRLWNWRASVYNHARRKTTSARSSGGTRRDDSKYVARTQKRRPRHVKGVTPTKPELFDQLEAEEDADEVLDSFEANGLGPAGNDGFEENVTDRSEEGIEATGVSEPNEDVNVEQETRDQVSNTSEKISGVEEIVEAGDSTYVVKFFPEGKKGPPKASRKNAQDKASDVSNKAQDTAEDVGSTVQEAGETIGENVIASGDEIQETVGDTTEDVTSTIQETAGSIGENVSASGDDIQETVGETAEDVTSTIQETAESIGEDVSATGDDIQEIVGDTTEDVTNTIQEAAESTGESLNAAGEEFQESVAEGSDAVAELTAEVADIVEDTAQDVVSKADETVQEVGKSAEQAGAAVSETLDAVISEGQKAFEEAGSYGKEKMEESRLEFEENASYLRKETEKSGDRLVQAGEQVSEEAGKSLQNIQESLSTLIDDSAKAAEIIGSEALRLGEVVLTVAGEAAGFQGTKEQASTSSRSISVEERPQTEGKKIDNGPQPVGTQGKQEIQGERYKSSQPKDDKEEDKNLYTGLKVTVAGASGRTGKLVVEELTRKGVSVRAVVRNKNSSEAQSLRKLSNVEVVEAELYRYESTKKALGDSNVVISAIGARSFAFDPIGTYQGEFEGVKNLIAAAKNKGDVKKFVFITSLGVTFLQIVPLLFWKKQSELYLQRSGLDYTIVRPGGLTNGRNTKEEISMKPADTQFGGSISRQKVAEVCVAALITPEASEKTVEIVSGGGSKSFSDLFGSV